MLIITDHRLPAPAQEKLRHYGELILFKTEGITYEAISGHPDIFFAKVAGQWIIAPNTPRKYLDIFDQRSIKYTSGELAVGKSFPETAKYNVSATQTYLLHNFRYTDSVITSVGEDLDLIHVNQGYTRCNLLALRNDSFITSDEGIYRVLQNYQLDTLLVNPKKIILPEYDHGFFGGTTGISNNSIFIAGNLDFLEDGKIIKKYLNNLDYEVIELYDGPLFDGGSILFFDE